MYFPVWKLIISPEKEISLVWSNTGEFILSCPIRSFILSVMILLFKIMFV